MDMSEKVLRLKPGDDRVHFNLGNLMMAGGQPDDAERELRRAVEINPADAVAHYNLGNALRELHRFEEALSAYDRALALRDGGVLAAKANRFGDAVRLFDKAHDAIGASTDGAALAGSFLVEKALVLWRAGDRAKALTVAGDALDAVEAFPADQSRQAERSHQYARAIVGLFLSEQTSPGDDSSPPFSFGHASSLEASDAKLLDIPFKSLADNWRLLASVEATLGADATIDVRSIAKQTGSLNVSVEANIRANRYAASLRSGDLERMLRAGLDLVNMARAGQHATPDPQGQLRIDPSKLDGADPRSLLNDASNLDAIQTVVLDLLLWKAIRGLVDYAFLVAVKRACTTVFGEIGATEAVLLAAADPFIVKSSDRRAEMLARGIAIPDVSADQDPRIRFFRDMMIVGHLAFSLGRTTLTSQVTSKIARGWQFVLDHQRFRLRNPRNGVPAIEAAIKTTETESMGRIAELLLAAADAVERMQAGLMLVQQARYNFGPGGLKHHRRLVADARAANDEPAPWQETVRTQGYRDAGAADRIGEGQPMSDQLKRRLAFLLLADLRVEGVAEDWRSDRQHVNSELMFLAGLWS
jgi:tetratricopeptide (TPR) repeat protein